MRSRLFWEIVLPYGAFALALLAGLVWAGGIAYEEAIRNQLLHRLLTASQAIAARDDVFSTSAANWQGDLVRFGKASDLRLTVLTGDGTPLVDTDVDPLLLKNLADLPEIREARRNGQGQSASGDRIAVAVAVRNPAMAHAITDGSHSSVVGFVRAEGSSQPISSIVSRWRRWSVALVGAAGLVGLLWAGWSAHRLSRPIGAFIESARRISRGAAASDTSLRTAFLSPVLDELATRLDAEVERLRRDNAALQETTERLSSILAGMGEGVIAIDRQERILFANSAAAAMLDIDGSKLVGRTLWEAIRASTIREVAAAALHGSQPQATEFELPRTQTVLALRVGLLPGDPPPGAVLVLHDVTELRRLENLRREFVSNVSHELKTPLASIKAYTETLLEGAIDDSERRVQFLTRIDEQAERLHGLIVNLLRLARIEAGTDVFDIKKLSAGQIIGPCVEEHTAIAISRGVTLTSEPPGEPVRLQADADGLRTILDNLLDNAIHYTPAGGRVNVRWSRANGEAVIEVADTGIGIPEEHLPRIFERFHRVDKARSREHGGTGLGLAIVKHLVQVFGGRIEVESELGRGSTFRVFLPTA